MCLFINVCPALLLRLFGSENVSMSSNDDLYYPEKQVHIHMHKKTS